MGLNKKFTIRIRKVKKPVRSQLVEVPPVRAVKKPAKRRILKAFFMFVLFSAACFFGAVLGTFMALRQTLPSVSELEEYEPNIITYIYADNGEVIGEYALEKRIEVPLEVIPDVLINAIIATEDARFYTHDGLDWRGVFRSLSQ